MGRGSGFGLKDCLEIRDLPSNTAAHLVAEIEDAGIVDRVHGARALLGSAHHSRGMQDAQVFGDVLLGSSQGFLKLADGGVAISQPIEQLDSHRLTQHPEALGDELDQRLRKRMGNGR